MRKKRKITLGLPDPDPGLDYDTWFKRCLDAEALVTVKAIKSYRNSNDKL